MISSIGHAHLHPLVVATQETGSVAVAIPSSQPFGDHSGLSFAIALGTVYGVLSYLNSHF